MQEIPREPIKKNDRRPKRKVEDQRQFEEKKHQRAEEVARKQADEREQRWRNRNAAKLEMDAMPPLKKDGLAMEKGKRKQKESSETEGSGSEPGLIEKYKAMFVKQKRLFEQ